MIIIVKIMDLESSRRHTSGYVCEDASWEDSLRGQTCLLRRHLVSGQIERCLRESDPSCLPFPLLDVWSHVPLLPPLSTVTNLQLFWLSNVVSMPLALQGPSRPLVSKRRFQGIYLYGLSCPWVLCFSHMKGFTFGLSCPSCSSQANKSSLIHTHSIGCFTLENSR